jgi:hypothetical protein
MVSIRVIFISPANIQPHMPSDEDRVKPRAPDRLRCALIALSDSFQTPGHPQRLPSSNRAPSSPWMLSHRHEAPDEWQN